MKNLTQSEKLFMLFQRGASFAGRGRQPRHSGGHGQGYVLSLLADGPHSQKELLEKLGVRAGSLSELLGKLENAGLITRTKDENDNRAVNVTITEEGRKLAAEHGRHREEIADSLFAALSDEEKAELTVLLEKLSEAWKQERETDDCARRGHGPRGLGRGASREHHERGPGRSRGGEHNRDEERGRGEKHTHDGEHRRGEEITDTELKAYLDGKTCGECDKDCKLSAPQCGKGAKKQQEAIADYKKI